MKRKITITLLLSILLIVYIYVTNITLFPDSIILMQGEKINLDLLMGLGIKEEQNSNPNIGEYQIKNLLQASSIAVADEIKQIGKIDLNLSLFDTIPLKEVSVNVIPKTTVIPLGNAIGLKLYTQGVLIVGMSQIEGKKPYENSGIKEGDRIISINDEQIDSTEELIETINSSKGHEITIKYIRNDNEETTSIIPVETGTDEYKIGLWVRDASAGVGTASFYVPSTGEFACLGHGISDIDTEELITIASGELVTTDIIDIQKGQRGKPGEIKGSIEGSTKIGAVYNNTAFGIFGKITNKSRLKIISKNEMEVLNRNEVKKGKAQIICEIEKGKVEYYDIEIEKIYTNNQKDNKSMLIKVTDERLLEKTGGIIQRNVWCTNNTRRKICWVCNTCASK